MVLLKQIGPINFVDTQSRQQGFVIVRAGEGQVGITLSLEDDGDIEVFIPFSDSERVLSALRQAILVAKPKAEVQENIATTVI